MRKEEKRAVTKTVILARTTAMAGVVPSTVVIDMLSTAVSSSIEMDPRTRCL